MKTREAMVAEGTAAYGDGETVTGTAADENDETPPPAPSGEGERRRMFMETPPTDDVCPICFGDFQVPCRAPCGHWYCGEIFLIFKFYFIFFSRILCTYFWVFSFLEGFNLCLNFLVYFFTGLLFYQ